MSPDSFDALRSAFARTFDLQRDRNARRLVILRAGAVGAWVALAIGFGVFGNRVDFRANLSSLLVYLALACGLGVGGLASKRFLKLSWYAVALVDIPFIFLIQRQGVRLAASPQATAAFTLGI